MFNRELLFLRSHRSRLLNSNKIKILSTQYMGVYRCWLITDNSLLILHKYLLADGFSWTEKCWVCIIVFCKYYFLATQFTFQMSKVFLWTQTGSLKISLQAHLPQFTSVWWNSVCQLYNVAPLSRIGCSWVLISKQKPQFQEMLNEVGTPFISDRTHPPSACPTHILSLVCKPVPSQWHCD